MGVHGGDVYGKHIDIDFSINVNPLGTPESVKAALHRAVEKCDRYPDIEARNLKEAVGGYLSVPEDYLLFGNGASELLGAIVHGIKPSKIVIPAPSFYGYEYAAKSIGCDIVYYQTKRQDNFCVTKDICNVLDKDTELLFLANPNNPVGNLLERETVRDILRHCRDRGIYVVLDECFIEFCGDGCSMLSEIGTNINSGGEEFANLIIVRAFTKIFAIPGVRLGYLVCSDRSVINRISAQLPEWNISCFAQEAGCICAGLKDFVSETQEYVHKERRFVEDGLRRKGFEVFPSDSNFILFYSERNLYESLLERGILIRDCGNFRGLGKGYYRIAVKSREDNEILIKSL